MWDITDVTTRKSGCSIEMLGSSTVHHLNQNCQSEYTCRCKLQWIHDFAFENIGL